MSDLPTHPECWPVSLRERFEERAAFHEFEAGMSREDAEAIAEKSVRRLHFLAGMAQIHNAVTRSTITAVKTFASATEGQ